MKTFSLQITADEAVYLSNVLSGLKTWAAVQSHEHEQAGEADEARRRFDDFRHADSMNEQLGRLCRHEVIGW